MKRVPDVSVIIPTLCHAARAPLLRRAIDSVSSQQGVRALPILVVNGRVRDPALLAALRKDVRLRILELDQAGIPDALRAGREIVDTAWFSALDDDDSCLPGSLAARVRKLQSMPAFDTVVTNGLICAGGGTRVFPPDLEVIEQDPLKALTQGNWLLPGAWLCRSDRVGPWLFAGMPSALECTFLALQFALRCRTCFLDQPGVAYQGDTAVSESKSPDYIHRQLPALEQLLALPLSRELEDWVQRMTSAVKHDISAHHLRERDHRNAWRWHLRSLLGRHGWRYASYTLRLILNATGK